MLVIKNPTFYSFQVVTYMLSHRALPNAQKYLKQPLKTAFLHSLWRQDIRELSVGVRHQQAGGNVLADELCDSALWTRRYGSGWRLAWLIWEQTETWYWVMEDESWGWKEVDTLNEITINKNVEQTTMAKCNSKNQKHKDFESIELGFIFFLPQWQLVLFILCSKHKHLPHLCLNYEKQIDFPGRLEK